MEETQRIYLPAAGHDWLLPFYDPLTKLLGIQSAHRELLDQADVQPAHRVLEIGCGTGNLAILAKRLYPEAEVVGLDPDPKALARAWRKAEREGLSIKFDRGFSDELPYPDGSFDRVLSAFMFHHLLTIEEKTKTLLETRRALTPGGSLHLLDFGGATGRSASFLEHVLHRTESFRDNLGDRIPTLMKEAGLEDPAEVAHRQVMILGRVTYYRASSPRSQDADASHGVGAQARTARVSWPNARGLAALNASPLDDWQAADKVADEGGNNYGYSERALHRQRC